MIYQQINQLLRQQTSFCSGKYKKIRILEINSIRKIDFHLNTVE